MIFPPGRARLPTKPVPTGSPATANTPACAGQQTCLDQSIGERLKVGAIAGQELALVRRQSADARGGA